jgi:hypothetical protein
MSLLELQRQFRAHLLDDASPIADQLQGDSPDLGLAVYHHAYRAQLVACLCDTYEKLWAWLGDDAFQAAADRYVAAHPPQSWTLSDYGATFPTRLAELYPDDPEVAELASLDWALRRAFDGEDASPIGAADLAEVDWETARFRFTPTLQVFPIRTNCAAIWNALAIDATPPAATHLTEPAAIRVWRLELAPQFFSMDACEYDALARLQQGASFSELCAHLGETLGEEQAALTIGQFLGRWLQDGLVIAIA